MFSLRLFIAISLVTFIPATLHAELTIGNLVVSINRTLTVAEYDTSGNRIQTFAQVPAPMNETVGHQFRDVAVSVNNVHIYNGTQSAELYNLDATSISPIWEGPLTFADWNTVNNLTFGGIARFRNFVFCD